MLDREAGARSITKILFLFCFVKEAQICLNQQGKSGSFGPDLSKTVGDFCTGFKIRFLHSRQSDG